MKVLLALDDSEHAEATTRTVLAQARPGETEVRVLHVVEPPSLLLAREMGGSDRTVELAWEAQRKQAEEMVARTAAALRAKGLEVTSAVVQGDAKSGILDVAAEWDADLIVLGSHGRKGVGRFLMGSVSEAVARHAPCSVEIVRMRPAH